MLSPTHEIKDRLIQVLREKNITPKELSEKTGIPKSSISQYMSGYAKPKQDRIYLISKALDTTKVIYNYIKPYKYYVLSSPIFIK